MPQASSQQQCPNIEYHGQLSLRNCIFHRRTQTIQLVFYSFFYQHTMFCSLENGKTQNMLCFILSFRVFVKKDKTQSGKTRLDTYKNLNRFLQSYGSERPKRYHDQRWISGVKTTYKTSKPNLYIKKKKKSKHRKFITLTVPRSLF